MIYGVHNGKQQKFSIKQKEDRHDTENLWSEHRVCWFLFLNLEWQKHKKAMRLFAFVLL